MGSPVSALTTVPLSERCCAAVRYAHTSQKGIVRSRQVALPASYPGDWNLVPVLNRRTKMPEERVELSWGCPRRILSPLRLPFRHSGPIEPREIYAGHWRDEMPRTRSR